MWRLEHDGCLRNKAHRDRCLGLETHTTGGGVVLQPEQGIDSQRWKFENKYIENLVMNYQYTYLTRDFFKTPFLLG